MQSIDILISWSRSRHWCNAVKKQKPSFFAGTTSQLNRANSVSSCGHSTSILFKKNGFSHFSLVTVMKIRFQKYICIYIYVEHIYIYVIHIYMYTLVCIYVRVLTVWRGIVDCARVNRSLQLILLECLPMALRHHAVVD